MPAYSVVIPVYGNEQSIPDLLSELDGLARSLPLELEVVFVVDGSPDRSAAILRELLPNRPFAAELVLHSRNFGSFAAIRTGLQIAKGELLGVMAADLQEPAMLMKEFFQVLEKGADVAYGVRVSRADPLLSAVSSRLFWSAYRRFVMPEIPPGGVDIFGLTRKAKEALLLLSERNSSLVAQLFWGGFSRAPVEYTRRVRPFGQSAWTFGRKLRYLADSVFGFSDLPIRLLTSAGVFSMLLAFIGLVVVLSARLMGAVSVPGYTPIVLAIAFFGGFNSFGLGVIGQYVWRAFENTKARPLSVIGGQLSFGRKQAE